MRLQRALCFLVVLFSSVQFASAQPITLVTLGDSLTAGDGDDGIGGGYPVRLINRLQATSPGSVLQQFAISGDTTHDLINKQLVPAVNALNAAPPSHAKIALVWIGSNDLFGLYNSTTCEDYYPDITTCENIELGDSANNVNTILTDLKATGAALYIALLDDQTKRPVIADPVLRGDTFPGITDADVTRMKTQISVYNDRVKTHAATHGAQTVDFFSTTLFENWATLSDDGNHPNGAGYDQIAEIWFNALGGAAPPPPPPTPTPTGNSITGPILFLLFSSD